MMLTEEGYSKLACDARVATALAAVEQLAYPEPDDPRVRQLDELFHQVAEGRDSPDGACTARPLDLLLMINRLMELHGNAADRACLAPYLDVGEALYAMVGYPRVAAEFLILHARYALLELDPAQAYILAHQAYALAEANNLPLQQGSALLVAARGQISLGHYSGASVYLDHAKQAADAAGDPALAFEVVLQQGALAMLTGDQELALSYTQAAQTQAPGRADLSAEVRAQVLAALAGKQPGDELSDLPAFNAARDDFARGGDPISYLTLLDYLGESFLAAGDLDRAGELTSELMTIAPRARQQPVYLRALNRQGRILLRLNHFYRAAGIFGQALRLANGLQFADEANSLKALLGLAQLQAGVGLAKGGGPETAADAKALADRGLARIVRAAGQACEEKWPARQLSAELSLLQAVKALAKLSDATIEEMAGSLPGLLRAEHPSGPEPPALSQAGLESWFNRHLDQVKISPLVRQNVMLKLTVKQLVQDSGG